MSKTNRPNYRREARGRRRNVHNITVRSVKRTPPDLAKLGRAVIALATAELEAEKQAAAETSAGEASLTASEPAPAETECMEVGHDD